MDKTEKDLIKGSWTTFKLFSRKSKFIFTLLYYCFKLMCSKICTLDFFIFRSNDDKCNNRLCKF